jgi:hypothetical protein
MATSSLNKPIVTTIKEPKPIKGRMELAIILYTLLLPIEPMEVLVVSSTQVEVLEEPVILKLVPLNLPEIRVGAKVTLIDNVTHVFKVFKIPDIILNNTLVMERPDPQLIHLVELVDTNLLMI